MSNSGYQASFLHAIRLEIAKQSGYLPPHLKFAGVSKEEYVQKIKQSEGAYLNQPIERFARSHLGTKFNGDLTIFIEAAKKNSTFNGENYTTASCSETPSNPSAVVNNDSVGNDSEIFYKRHKPAMSATGKQMKREVMAAGENKKHNIVVEKQEDLGAWEVKFGGSIKTKGHHNMLEVYTPGNPSTFEFSQMASYKPMQRYLKPMGFPLHAISEKMLMEERALAFVKALNPDRPDSPQEDTIFYPPTRRCDPRTVALPRRNNRDKPWMGNAAPSRFPTVPHYPVPKNSDGSEVKFAKTGAEWLRTAWEFDIFPLYNVEDGVYWDFRDVVNDEDDGVPDRN
ncbi:hypothetical protein RUND412_000157 [Rhizina undulata]